jgi:Chlorophyll A-B binding protein
MKTAILATLIASAAAFAPAKDASRSTALNMAFESELGAQPPLGFFDPLGLVADGDAEKFDRLRYVEIKHGRICMLGVVGYLVNAAGIYLPGDISTDGTKFSDLGYGWDASFAVPVAGALQVLAFVGLLEVAGWKQAEGSFPGDFSGSGFPVGWVGDYTEEEKLNKRAIELNQGRAAQMGMLALMVHDKLGNVEDFFPSV